MRKDVVDFGAFRVATLWGEVTLVRDDKVPKDSMRLMTDRAECPLVGWLGTPSLATIFLAIDMACAEGMEVHRVLLSPEDMD